ncbi:hypothetical protein EDD66_10815 [Mobilisporobacter senegalensis]|uniref:Nucleoid associated protein NdpA n=1 Tax=Mobilisporobacter senegalensis TaxID=1329262 RepID=A0A3N1XHW9_9FIRM|nr:hypothetical protein [Mobilisporobacter senegalensis]ROR26293.1 hypothetical protein EDD66_10815 [Mobilisporobacter senegalensis]
MDFEPLFTTLHAINTKDDNVERRDISDNDVVDDYIKTLTLEIKNSNRYKRYKTSSNNTEVVTTIMKALLNEHLDQEEMDIIANRLLKKEQDAQRKIKALPRNIREGSLIQCLFKSNDDYYCLISKVELGSFLDFVDLLKKEGLPYTSKALKNCLFKFNENKEIEDIWVSDTSSSNAAYWYKDFLELEECTTNEISTKNSFDLIEKSLSTIKKSAPKDYYNFRNQLISYYKTQPIFDYDNMIDYVFGTYTPEVLDETNINNIKNRIQKTFLNKKIDTQFDIIRDQIKAKSILRVNEFVEININNSSADFKSKIQAFEEENKMYLKIETDNEEVYNAFK